MARLTQLPSMDIIRGFKGVLDFYLWKGLPCVRRWATTPKSRQTAATKAAALLFGQVLKNYRLLAEIVLVAYQQIAAGTPRTARDVYVSGVYGHLHEASMSDFLSLLTACRDSLLALEALLAALGSVDTDDLQVDVKTSALPGGASSLAEQQPQTAALEKIDDLQDALHSANLDELVVRGEDQLFSFKGVLALDRSAAISGAGGYVESLAVNANQIWVVTTIAAQNNTTAPTRIMFANRHDAVTVTIDEHTKAFAIAERHSWSGITILDHLDTIRAYFTGGLVGDTCAIEITGYRMTLET